MLISNLFIKYTLVSIYNYPKHETVNLNATLFVKTPFKNIYLYNVNAMTFLLVHIMI